MPKHRLAISRPTKAALMSLANMIRAARRERRWSEAELAERLGVSRTTIQKIERGEATTAVGAYFEACTMLGIPLFGANESQLETLATNTSLRLALLPEKVRKPRPRNLSDEF